MQLDSAIESSATKVIATILNTSEIPVADSTALLLRAATFTAVAARSGPWDSLRDIALVARREALAAHTPPELRHSALSFLASLSRSDVIDGLIESACNLGSLEPALEALLAASGDKAVWGIARALVRSSGPADADLRSFLLRLGQSAWEKALESAGKRAFEELTVLLPLIARMPPVSARTLGYTLLKHEDRRVCRRVLAFLLNLERQDESWQRLVRWALESTDQELADIARSAVLQHPSPDPCLLESALGAGTPTAAGGRLRQDLERLIETMPTEVDP